MVMGGDLGNSGLVELLSFDPTRPVPECLQNLNNLTFGAYRNGAAAPLTEGKFIKSIHPITFVRKMY